VRTVVTVRPIPSAPQPTATPAPTSTDKVWGFP
jgi:hypothetical protein